MTNSQFINFAKKMVSTKNQRRRAKIAAGLMRENKWLGKELHGIGKADLEDLYMKTPEKVKILIDLAIASGRTNLSNVVSTDSNRNLLIKLGLKYGSSGVELDFKAYTPEGLPAEPVNVKYKPSPQKLSGIQGTAIEDVENYGKWIDDDDVYDDIIDAWATIAGFNRTIDECLRRTRDIADKMMETDYIKYPLGLTKEDEALGIEEPVALRFNRVQDAIRDAKTAINAELEGTERKYKKKMLNDLLNHLNNINETIDNINANGSSTTANGYPIYDEETAGAHYRAVLAKVQNLFDHVREIAKKNLLHKQNLAAEIAKMKIKNFKDTYTEPDVSDFVMPEVELKKAKRDAIKFFVDTKGMTPEQARIAIKEGYEEYNRSLFLEETNKLHWRKWTWVKGSTALFRDPEGNTFKYRLTPDEEKEYQKWAAKKKRYKEQSKSAKRIFKYTKELHEAAKADPENKELQEMYQSTVKAAWQAHYKKSMVTWHGRIDTNLHRDHLTKEQLQQYDKTWYDYNDYRWNQKVRRKGKEIDNAAGIRKVRTNLTKKKVIKINSRIKREVW